MSYHVPGSMCVGVTVRFDWGDVVSLCRLRHYCFVSVECGGSGFMAVWNSGLVTSVGLSLFNYQDDARSNKHKKKIMFLYILIF
jgi:hypothetical protein